MRISTIAIAACLGHLVTSQPLQALNTKKLPAQPIQPANEKICHDFIKNNSSTKPKERTRICEGDKVKVQTNNKSKVLIGEVLKIHQNGKLKHENPLITLRYRKGTKRVSFWISAKKPVYRKREVGVWDISKEKAMQNPKGKRSLSREVCKRERKSIMKMNSKPVESRFPVRNGHGPFVGNFLNS
ncbi:MAG: hypothetical protein QNJ31_08255, partial [Candidatus Caenarcaniphilales bacterium]|nr:hypothetical protein [Candidatus Caenarcaniphilales bacterium]